MNNKFSSFSLTLLVLLAGVLIFAPVLTVSAMTNQSVELGSRLEGATTTYTISFDTSYSALVKDIVISSTEADLSGASVSSTSGIGTGGINSQDNNTFTYRLDSLEDLSDGATTLVLSDVDSCDSAGDYSLTIETKDSVGAIVDTGTASYTIIPAPTEYSVEITDGGPVTAGEQFGLTITALDDEGNPVTQYEGDKRVGFSTTASNSSSGVAPTVPTFLYVNFSDGVATTPESFILTKAVTSTPKITATPPAGSFAGGTTSAITVNPAGLNSFAVEDVVNDTVTAGDNLFSEKVTVTGLDEYENTVTSYTGTPSWSSSDSAATLPSGKAFTSGTAEFDEDSVILKTVTYGEDSVSSGKEKTQSVTITDGSVTKSITSTVEPSTASSVEISADPATIKGDGADSSTVTATVLDEYGNRATGFSGSWNFDYNIGNLPSVSSGDGQATKKFTSSEYGTATVEVQPGSITTPATVDITVEEFTGYATSLTLGTPTPSSLDFSESFEITATLTSGGTAVSGVDVSFGVFDDAGNVLDTDTGVTTNSDGEATGSLQAPYKYYSAAFDVKAEFAGNSSYSQDSVTSTDVVSMSGTKEKPVVKPDTGWSMISVDAVPASPSASTVFGTDSGALFYWNGTQYLQGDNVGDVSVKKGYWFYASSVFGGETDIVKAGSGYYKVSGDVVVELADTGWHMISAPFDVGWGQAKVKESSSDTWQTIEDATSGTDPIVSKFLVAYDPGSDSADDAGYVWYEAPAGTVDGTTGYWFKTNVADVDLKLPFSPTGAPEAAAMGVATAKPLSGRPAGVSGPPAPPEYIKEAAATELKATALASAGEVTFKVTGGDVQAMKVQVFNTNGAGVFTDEAASNSLSWNAGSVANGIYLYGVSAKVGGDWKPLGIQKLLLLN